MATDTCEVWETELEGPEAMEELPLFAEHVPGLSLEDLGQDAEVPQHEEEEDRAHEMEPEERSTLHVIEQDLEEFVESMTDTPGAMETHVPRVEEAEEETSAAVPEDAPQSLPVTRKVESRAAGKEAALWAGLSLNKCILLASVVALLSLGFQALQDASDMETEAPEAEPRLWAWPQSSLPEEGASERGEPWFFWSWLEPEAADPEAKVAGVQQESPRGGQEKLRALEKKEEKPRESGGTPPEKALLPKDRPPESKASRVPRGPPEAGSEQEEEEEEEGEGPPRSSKRARGEGKEGRQRERPRRDEGQGHQPKPGRKERRQEERPQQREEPKGRRPWGQHKSFGHKFKEGKKHD